MNTSSRLIAIPVALAIILTLTFTFTLGAEAEREGMCSDSIRRELDFVVGNWIVNDPSDSVVGTVNITAEYGGCVLVEHWRGVDARNEGLAVIGYRDEARLWHRDFLDREGVVLSFDGWRDGPRMVMTGREYRHDAIHMHRVIWAPSANGTIRQLSQVSSDTGRSWQSSRDVALRRISE